MFPATHSIDKHIATWGVTLMWLLVLKGRKKRVKPSPAKLIFIYSNPEEFSVLTCLVVCCLRDNTTDWIDIKKTFLQSWKRLERSAVQIRRWEISTDCTTFITVDALKFCNWLISSDLIWLLENYQFRGYWYIWMVRLDNRFYQLG